MDDLKDLEGPADYPPPPELPAYLGNLLMEFSYAETATHFLIWRILGVTLADGRSLTARVDIVPRLRLLDDLCERHIASSTRKKQLLAATKALAIASDYRNMAAHGDWRTKASGKLYCFSIRYEPPEGDYGAKPVDLTELSSATEDSHNATLDLWDIDAWLKKTPRESW